MKKFLLAIASVPLLCLAAGKPSSKDVDRVFASYRAGKAIKAKVHKTVEQEDLGTTMKSRGTFSFSRGKLRLDILEPERTVLVYDGKTIWFESRADEDHVLVTKLRASELRKSDSILAALFDRKDVFKNFQLKKVTQDGEKKTFDFVAKDKKSEIRSLEIVLKAKELQRISYKDQINNKVTLEFSDLGHASLPAETFAYKPPKGAEITEM